MNEGISVRK